MRNVSSAKRRALKGVLVLGLGAIVVLVATTVVTEGPAGRRLSVATDCTAIESKAQCRKKKGCKPTLAKCAARPPCTRARCAPSAPTRAMRR